MKKIKNIQNLRTIIIGSLVLRFGRGEVKALPDHIAENIVKNYGGFVFTDEEVKKTDEPKFENKVVEKVVAKWERPVDVEKKEVVEKTENIKIEEKEIVEKVKESENIITEDKPTPRKKGRKRKKRK